MYKECRHIKPDGAKCESPALKDMPYCYYHDRLHRSGSRQKPSPRNGIELQPLEDRSSIQLAISHVICALADGRLDASRAGQLFYGFQVAAQFASFVPKSAASNSVDSLTRTNDGQELAPEKIKCFEGDDCETCPCLEECGGDEEYRESLRKEEQGDEGDDDDDDKDAGQDEDEEEAGSNEDSGDDEDTGEYEDTGEDDEPANADQEPGKNADEASSGSENAEAANDGSEDDSEGDDEFAGESTEELIAGLKYLDSIRRQAGLDP